MLNLYGGDYYVHIGAKDYNKIVKIIDDETQIRDLVHK